MYDLVDFTECEFISTTMKFYNYEDFVKESKLIKRNFEKLSKNGKIFYMWYIYANTHMNLVKKNRIWDYLNNYCDLINFKK